MKEYTFPFDTCEIPQETGIAQPYSVSVNIITCLIVLSFLLHSKNIPNILLLLSLFVFEVFHTFSHFIHIKGPLQYTITHIAGFLVNIAFFNLLYRTTNVFPPVYYIVFLLLILSIDLYSFFNLSFIYFVFTQIFFFIAILGFYYPLLPQKIKYNLHIILGFTLLIYLCFVNEKINCKRMLTLFPQFPFHVIIEIVSIIPIYLLSSTFYK